MSIVKTSRKPIVHKDEDDFIAEQFANAFRRGEFLDKDLQDRVNIMCKAIVKIINDKYPPKKRFRPLTDNQLYRYCYLSYAIEVLTSEIHAKWLKDLETERKR